ncbi:hypothetical protein [Bdellovibrio sp. NC01]|uniref:hypothetical protein n=1 Tax=Bdellovibrio sp. NC01 TaxID=2220073 RepID=UPI00115A7267|nr:hypothetical protein [Bdellovibrio sp. NC01]QDK39009.1 hypothetical protein DOE51_16155 [Bdellovibrio sp. NC01]
MSFTDKKFEMAIFTLVAVLVGGLGYLMKSPVQAVLANAELVYEMPRPKSFLAALFGLGLEDREIDRKYVNPFDKKKADDKKKTADAKDAKKPAAPAQVAAKKADAKKADAAKKPSVDVKVVGADSHNGLTGSDIANGADGAGAGAIANNNVANTGAANDPANDENTLSGAQWSALLSAQPTKENAYKMVTAFVAGKLDAASFYSIVNGLLKSTKSDTQAVGLYALSPVYTTQGFTVVAENYSLLATANQNTAMSYMQSYGTKNASGALVGALKSNDTDVVTLASQVIVKAYQTKSISDPRNTRGDVVSTSTPTAETYKPYVDALTQLRAAGGEIGDIASQALSQMQSVVAAL